MCNVTISILSNDDVSPLAAVVCMGHRVLDTLAVEILTGGVAIGNGPAANSGSFTSYGSHEKTLRKIFLMIFHLQPQAHLKCPLAPEGDPDVVGEGDAPLVQEDLHWPLPGLRTEAVSGCEGHIGHRPGLP